MLRRVTRAKSDQEMAAGTFGFLPAVNPDGVTWCDTVIARGALERISELTTEGPTLVEGAAAALVVREWMKRRDEELRTARSYLKAVSRVGDHVFWDAGDGLAEHAQNHPSRFMASIYEYHAHEQPWLSADAIFERVSP